MSHKSLSKTIPDKHFTPVVIKGYKREFNLETDTKKSDYLNLIKVKKEILNGVLFRVNEKELTKIKKREAEYNLEETKAYDFLTGKKVGKCLIVIDYLVGIDNKKNKPDKKYFIQCREAAYHISREFGKFWDNTTYIKDNQKVSRWIKKNKSYDTIKLV